MSSSKLVASHFCWWLGILLTCSKNSYQNASPCLLHFKPWLFPKQINRTGSNSVLSIRRGTLQFCSSLLRSRQIQYWFRMVPFVIGTKITLTSANPIVPLLLPPSFHLSHSHLIIGPTIWVTQCHQRQARRRHDVGLTVNTDDSSVRLRALYVTQSG